MRYLTHTFVDTTPDRVAGGCRIAGQTRRAMITLELDEDAIYQALARKAIRSRGGKSTALGGLITARIRQS